jgi:hypothetical protein
MAKTQHHYERSQYHMRQMLNLLVLIEDSIRNLFVVQTAENCGLEFPAIMDMFQRYREHRSKFDLHTQELLYADPGLGRDAVMAISTFVDPRHLALMPQFSELAKIYHPRRALS